MDGRSVKRVQGQSWYFPHWLIPLLLEANGGLFDLDPSGQPEALIQPVARRRGSGDDAGAPPDWKGSVFFNPQNVCGAIEPWVNRALRSVHWDKAARVVVALLPVDFDAPWWTTYVRGWASVFLIRSRARVGVDRQRPPFASALVIWGQVEPFRAAFDRLPRSDGDGVWLPAYRAESKSAPFLMSVTTRAKMQKLYGSYDSFRENLTAWTARVPPEYSEFVALGDGRDAAIAAAEAFRTNSLGFITHLNGKPLYKRKRIRKKKDTRA